MRARIGFAAVWIATTATGIAISWTGVGGAVRGTALDSPELAAEVPVRQGRPPALSSTAAPVRSPTPTPSKTGPGRGAEAGAEAGDEAGTGAGTGAGNAPRGERSASKKPSRAPDEKVRTYTVKSGRVVLALSGDAARLVSATPDNGFRAKVWEQDKWLRVDLTDDVHGSAVFAKWNGHPPIIQVYEY